MTLEKELRLIKPKYQGLPQHVYEEVNHLAEDLRELAPQMKSPGDVGLWLLLENQIRLIWEQISETPHEQLGALLDEEQPRQ